MVREHQTIACHIVVLGLMGVGKSTVGRELARHLDRPYLDSDADIERLTGRSGRELVETHGVAELHRLEAAVLLGALARVEPCVISAAASVVDDPLVRRILGHRSFVVRLRADLDEVIRRQGEGGHRRPMDRVELQRLAARREPLFADVENLAVDADRGPDQVVEEILAGIGRAEADGAQPAEPGNDG